MEQWNQVAQTRETLRSDLDSYFGGDSSQVRHGGWCFVLSCRGAGAVLSFDVEAPYDTMLQCSGIPGNLQ